MILDIPGTLKNNQSHHDKVWNKVVLQQDGKGKKRFLKTKTKWRERNQWWVVGQVPGKRTSLMCAVVVYAV
jgi:hypothetical protein